MQANTRGPFQNTLAGSSQKVEQPSKARRVVNALTESSASIERLEMLCDQIEGVPSSEVSKEMDQYDALASVLNIAPQELFAQADRIRTVVDRLEAMLIG